MDKCFLQSLQNIVNIIQNNSAVASVIAIVFVLSIYLISSPHLISRRILLSLFTIRNIKCGELSEIIYYIFRDYLFHLHIFLNISLLDSHE